MGNIKKLKYFRDNISNTNGRYVSIIFSILLLLALNACNGAASYRGYRVQLQNKDEVYSEFDMSLFRGIMPDMSPEEMIEVAGEPMEYHDYKKSGETFHNPMYYTLDGKVEVAWDGEYKEIGLVKYKPFNTKPLPLESFVHNPFKLGITYDMEDFAVYVDDVMYFIVHVDNGNITEIDYWLCKAEYF